MIDAILTESELYGEGAIPRARTANPKPRWRPLADLREPNLTVEFQTDDGIVEGWLSLRFNGGARTFWVLEDGTARVVFPIRWRELD